MSHISTMNKIELFPGDVIEHPDELGLFVLIISISSCKEHMHAMRIGINWKRYKREIGTLGEWFTDYWKRVI